MVVLFAINHPLLQSITLLLLPGLVKIDGNVLFCSTPTLVTPSQLTSLDTAIRPKPLLQRPVPTPYSFLFTTHFPFLKANYQIDGGYL